ncbi:MAG: hypothetical protein BGO12_09970 [Verrucomicrobia bacterium 61-8]|nr:4'-phosphopantetheinyl transferase superfamily protein [Verrucomicrobiota bacterium]OJV03527.1 MAG: hypothetical protein BGO12_09970 [Verrucomicrobia bacterium 61-8]
MENIQIAAWNENSSAFREAGGDMDVWKIFPNLRNKSDLPEAELLRCEAINNPLARQHELSSRIGVRRILGRYTGVLPSVLTFEREGRGKPFLAGGPQFNLSHTKDQILLGVGREPVGLDVESIDRKVKAEELASKFFHEEERAAVLGDRHGDEHRAFLKYWVCKEATVKLSGDGIYHGLRDARILWKDGRISGSYRGRAVYLSIFSPGSGFLAAVASWTPLRALRFFSLGDGD